MRVKKNLMKYRNPSTGQFEPIPVLVSESANEKFELIESFEVTEEIADFVRTAEPDGTPYDFQKIKVIVVQQKAEKNGSAGILVGEPSSTNEFRNSYISSGQAFNNTYVSFSEYNARVVNGIIKGDAITIVAKEEATDIEKFIREQAYISSYKSESLFSILEKINMDKIERILYRSLNSYPIPVGTKIDIYAVRS